MSLFGAPRVLILVLALLSVGLAGCTSPGHEPGQPAPDFTLTATDGTNYALSDYKGKPVFLFFMASWCGSCKIYSQGPMQEIADKVRAADGLVLAISLDPNDSKADLERFSDRTGSDWPYALDPEQVWREYKVWTTSVGVVISPQQEILLTAADPPKDEVLALLEL